MSRLLGAGAIAVAVFAFASCTSTGTTLVRPEGRVIYRISEEQAFTTALEAYASLYPKQSVDDIVDGTRRGYNADERSWMDYWSHRVHRIESVRVQVPLSSRV
jgi:hypothetical protein